GAAVAGGGGGDAIERCWKSRRGGGSIALGVVPIKSRRGEDKRMITKLNATSIMVLDKDEALDFYVNKVGLEKGQDIKQGSYRWLTVRVPDDPGTEISLEEPGPPGHAEATAAQLRELITKRALAGPGFPSA